jgi:hypothetical protein
VRLRPRPDRCSGAVLTDAARTRWELSARRIADGQSVAFGWLRQNRQRRPFARSSGWRGEALPLMKRIPSGGHSRISLGAWGQRTARRASASQPVLRRFDRCRRARARSVSGGGDVAFISTPDAAALDAKLRELGLRGMTLARAPLWCGVHPQTQIALRGERRTRPAAPIPLRSMTKFAERPPAHASNAAQKRAAWQGRGRGSQRCGVAPHQKKTPA